MANSTLPEEDKADIPGIRRKESLSSNTAGGNSWSTSSSTGASSGGATTGTGGGFAKNNFLRDQEESPDDLVEPVEADDDDDQDDNGLYTPDGNSNSTGRKRGRFLTRRRAAVGGGIATVATGAIIGSFSIIQGPLEFVHIAQLMDRFHFSSQQDAEDGRLMRIARYIRDPKKPQNTRLGIVGTAVANKLETKVEKATGLKPEFDSTSGRFLGYSIDKSHDEWKGKSEAQIQQELNGRGGTTGNSVTTKDGKLIYNPEHGISFRQPIKAYRAQTSFSRTLLVRAGYSKVSSYTGTRLLGTRAGWTFHPVKKLDAKIQAAALEQGKKGIDKLKEQFAKQELDLVEKGAATALGGTSEGEKKTNSDGSTSTNSTAEANSAEVNGVKDEASKLDPTSPQTREDFKKNVKASTKVGGGAATGVGLACVIRNLSQSIDHEKQAKVILPLMSQASEAIALGSQVQAGQDLSAFQLKFYKDFLAKKDANGNVVSTWNQSQSIQAELGQPQSNNDLPQSEQVFNKGNAFDFLDNVPLLGTACGILSGTLGQIFGIVTGPVNYVLSGAALEKAVSVASDWLSGAPVDPMIAGADRGSNINYGSRLSANEQYGSAGGAQMSSDDESSVKTVTASLDKSEFQSKSLAYRLFNPYDSQTLASRLIDDNGGRNPTQTFASLLQGFGSIFASIFKIPGSMFGHASAASQPYDYHGIKKVGFTTQELADSKYENPFQNGCLVAGGKGCDTGVTPILDSSNGSGYIDKVQKCFGVNISGDSSSGWNIDSKTSSINFTDGNFPGDCQDSGNTDWLRIRFWLLDTQTIEGFDCYQSDTPTSDQSCSDLGFDASTNASSDSTSSPATGNAQELAKQILSNNNVDLGCYSASVKQDVDAAADGKAGTAGAMTSSAILKLIATVGQDHKVCITAIQSNGQGHTDGSLHYSGDAVDFGSLDGVTITGRNAPAITILKQSFSVLPNGTGVGQSTCGATPSLPDSWITFDDSCNHLHVQVPRGTP